MQSFDFTETFSQIGRLFVRGLGLRIRQQRGIDGASYARPAITTLEARQRMLAGTRTKKGITLKGKTRKVQAVGAEGLTGVPLTRLLVSQDTANRAFQSEAAAVGHFINRRAT